MRFAFAVLPTRRRSGNGPIGLPLDVASGFAGEESDRSSGPRRAPQNELFEMRNDGAEKVAQKRSQAPEIVRSRKLVRAYPEARASRSADSQSETDPRR
jgi:hypothetical protein